MDDLDSRISKEMPSRQDTLTLDSQGVLEDLAATKKRADNDHQSLLDSLISSDQFLDSLPAGLILQDAQGRLVDCNDLAAAILGASREELLRRVSDDPEWNCVREDGSAFPHDEQPANVTLRTGAPCSNVVMGTNNQRQSRRWVSINTFQVDLEQGPPGVISSFVDITSQRRKDRSLKLLTEVNRVMMFAHDESSCFEQLCRVLVEHGDYALAWIAIVSNGEDGGEVGGVNVATAAGATDYLFDDIEGWWGSTESGKGPPGIALRTGETQVVNDLANTGGPSGSGYAPQNTDSARSPAYRSTSATAVRRSTSTTGTSSISTR